MVADAPGRGHFATAVEHMAEEPTLVLLAADRMQLMVASVHEVDVTVAVFIVDQLDAVGPQVLQMAFHRTRAG